MQLILRERGWLQSLQGILKSCLEAGQDREGGAGTGSLQKGGDVLLICFEFPHDAGTQVIQLDKQTSPELQEEAAGPPTVCPAVQTEQSGQLQKD